MIGILLIAVTIAILLGSLTPLIVAPILAVLLGQV